MIVGGGGSFESSAVMLSLSLSFSFEHTVTFALGWLFSKCQAADAVYRVSLNVSEISFPRVQVVDSRVDSRVDSLVTDEFPRWDIFEKERAPRSMVGL